jgi:tetratricopeptide (TPR) repeat protein
MKPDAPETFSLYGEPLYKSPILLWLPTEPTAYQVKLKELKDNLHKAKEEYRQDPDDPEKLLWVGRRTGILGNFMEAAALYSNGVEKWADDPRFYRFRGHRFVILRRIDLAISDFEKAAELIRGRPDEPELYASGGKSENKMGVASFNWNVYYHQGFTYYAAGLYEKAVQAYRDCMDAADNLESKIATTHWLYMPLIRLGRWNEAERLLEIVEPDMELVEVGDYYETLLMYKGYTTPEKLLEKARNEGTVRFMTRAQAIGNLYMAKGEREKAVEVYREILRDGSWTGGVYLCAECELSRHGLAPR